MAKIYCHINLCNATVQYFAILHADKFALSRETYIPYFLGLAPLLKLAPLLGLVPPIKLQISTSVPARVSTPPWISAAFRSAYILIRFHYPWNGEPGPLLSQLICPR